MTKTENKREEKKRKVIMPAGIRNKLVAAISMLMVASIMMVSSTYAWFTLSTAPEVKGITTNVGANGNLEMMLLNKASFTSTDENLGVESNVGDSMATENKNVIEANLTWGNLVDLSNQSYGLNSIVLNPAQLNIADGKLVGSILKAPSYGNDGRVIDIDQNTYTASYTDQQWKLLANDEKAFGVRVIGTTSGVTARLTEYRAAASQVTIKNNAAQNAAKQSLIDNGQKLANIIVAYALDEDAKFTKEQVSALEDLINALQTANNSAGEAIVQAVLAYNLSAANTEQLSDADVTAIKTALTSVNPTTIPDSYPKPADSTVTNNNIQLPGGYDTAKTQWNNNDLAISAALTKITTLLNDGTKTEYKYGDIRDIVNGLIDKDHATIAGKKPLTSNDKDAVVNYYTTYNRIDIVMEDGSGIYADIAKLVGDYTASGFKVHVSYKGLNADVPIAMSTAVVGDGTMYPLISKIDKGSAPAADVNANNAPVLTDHFGYALDFGFRTNAATSNLLLQTKGIQRVYSDYQDGEQAPGKTQGGGSYMQFTTENVKQFYVTEVRALMSALRVVFVEPTDIKNENDGTVSVNYTVLGIAKPEITGTTAADTGITTYTGGTVIDKDGKTITGENVADDATGAAGIKAELALYNYTVTDGVITLGLKKGQTAGENGAVTGEVDNTLTALTQNVAKKVTAIVYLDGDIVDNTMVANAVRSMKGKLNLQFASDANLVPMQNANMRNDGGTDGTEKTVTYGEPVATAGASYTIENVTGTVRDGYSIYKGSDDNFYYKTANSDYILMTKNNAVNALIITTGGN